MVSEVYSKPRLLSGYVGRCRGISDARKGYNKGYSRRRFGRCPAVGSPAIPPKCLLPQISCLILDLPMAPVVAVTSVKKAVKSAEMSTGGDEASVVASCVFSAHYCGTVSLGEASVGMTVKMFERMGLLWAYLAMAFPYAVQAQFACHDYGDGTCVITGYSGAGGDVIVPDTISNLMVTGVGGAFEGRTDVTSVTIGTNVIIIWQAAFSQCSLASVIMPASLTTIQEEAFWGCSNLTSVTFGDNVVSIGNEAFYGCSNIISVTFGSNIVAIGNDAFAHCSKLTSVALPDKVTTLGQSAFGECTSLTNVTIGSSVTSIGFMAFELCASLTSITIPHSVTNIETAAFADCTSLISITIPNSVNSIGWNAFWGCTNLTSVYFTGNAPVPDRHMFDTASGYDPATVYYLPSTIGWGATFGGLPTVPVGYAFTNNGDGTCTITGYTGDGGNVTIPDTISNLVVTSIGYQAFSGRTNLTNVTMGTNLISIGIGAFGNCGNLTNVVIPDSVTSIGIAAFQFTSLISVALPSSITSVGVAIFDNCHLLTSVTIPSSITSIGNVAFDECTSLANVTIPASVTNIGGYAFNSCFSLTNVAIPASVTSIGDYAFQNCSSLTNVTMLFGVTSIGENAFAQCDRLAIVTIPACVISIGAGAFFECYSLTSVTIPNGVTSLSGGPFYLCTSLTNVTIPASVTNIGIYTFYCCTSLTDVTIPDSVTSIGHWAFAYCYDLRGIYFRGNAPSLGSDVFHGDNATLYYPATVVYYLPGTTNWTNPWGSLPTVLWNPHTQSDANFGIQTNRFGFTITNDGSPTIVTEACTNLLNPVWTPVGTNTLTGGSSYFADPQWTTLPCRYYRFRSP